MNGEARSQEAGDRRPASGVEEGSGRDFGLRTADFRYWTFSVPGLLLLVFCFLRGVGLAQDEVPVPPLEEGALFIFHPIAVHFAIALTCFGCVLDWLGSVREQSAWQQAGKICFFAGVVALGFAALSGWIEHELPRPPGLARFFERVVRQALGDLRLGGPTEGAYLAALLARFARADELYAIRDAADRPLDSVAGLLIEAERAWDFRAPDFDPFRERRVRQHVGDYALFMTGLFREHVERRVGAAYYIRQGQRAYQAVADFERSALRPEARLFAALAAGFERYAAALAYLKRVYFRPDDLPSSLQPVLRLLTQW